MDGVRGSDGPVVDDDGEEASRLLRGAALRRLPLLQATARVWLCLQVNARFKSDPAWYEPAAEHINYLLLECSSIWSIKPNWSSLGFIP
jgi:hypothetical protein